MIEGLVSVVIPTYNDVHYLRSVLDDLLNQTYEKYEVIIVNDGSTDNTEDIVDEYVKKDPRFKLFSKENGGTGSALNFGFEKVQGEFGTWWSSDDRKKSMCLEVLVECLKKNRDVEFVVSSFKSEFLDRTVRLAIADPCEAKGYTLWSTRQQALRKEIPQNPKPHFVDEWVTQNFFACCLGVNFMFTMRLQKEMGRYLEIPGEDYHMAVKMGLHSRVAWIDKVLGTHSSPPDSLSNMDRNCVAQANVLTRRMVKEKYKHWCLKNIPKVAHFYWGAEKMSYMRYMTLYSFKKLNPDWSVKLYIPKELNSEKTWKDLFHQSDTKDYLSEKDYFSELKKMPIKITKVDFPEHIKRLGEAQKSDYLRWRLLYKEGGLWSDMDIIYHRPMTDIYLNNENNSTIDNTISIIPDTFNSHQIGFYLSSPKNSMFKELCLLSSEKRNVDLYQDLGCYLLNKYLRSQKQIEEKFNVKTINIKQSVVYKLNHQNLDQIYSQDTFNKNYIDDEETIGIHWYGGAEISQQYNNKIDHNSVKDINNTIAEAIKYTLKNKGN
jgi:glycosyltransferase involved in cell wall biosynthesis